MNDQTSALAESLRQAIGQLYENERLTDALTDEAAQHLLGWAERQLDNLAAARPNPAAFDQAAHQLQRVVRAINHLIGEQAGLGESALVEALTDLAGQAIEIYYQPSAKQQEEADDQEEEHQQQEG